MDGFYIFLQNSSIIEFGSVSNTRPKYASSNVPFRICETRWIWINILKSPFSNYLFKLNNKETKIVSIHIGLTVFVVDFEQMFADKDWLLNSASDFCKVLTEQET